MLKRSLLVLTIIPLAGCSANIAGFTFMQQDALKPGLTIGAATDIAAGAQAVKYSDISSVSINFTDINVISDSSKRAFVPVDENWNVKRFVPIEDFNASDVPPGLTPTFVKKASGNAASFVRVPDQKSAEFAWYAPLPVMFDSRLVLGRLGATDGTLLPMANYIGSTGLNGNTSVATFEFQFPATATGDFEVTLGEGYAYVHWDQQSDEMAISHQLLMKDYRGCSQTITAAIDFTLADPAGNPVYGLSRSDFEYSINTSLGAYFSEGEFSNVSTGSYRITIPGGKFADQPNSMSLKFTLPRLGTSAERTQSL